MRLSVTHRQLIDISGHYMSDPDKSRWYLYYNSAAYTLHQGTDKEHDITLGFTTPWGMIAYYFGLYRPETRKQRNTRQATTLLNGFVNNS